VVNFFNWSLEKAGAYPDCLALVREKVKPDRDKIVGRNSESTRRGTKWWLYGQDANIMYSCIASLSRVLIKARVSKHHMLAFMPNGMVYSDATVVFAVETYHGFAVLQSCWQEQWAAEFSSSLETRLRGLPHASWAREMGYRASANWAGDL
jgi:hypothetical protein